MYFAALRDLAQTNEERVSLGTKPQSVESFLRLLEERHPELAGRLPSVRVAVDEDVWHRVRIGPITDLTELNRLRTRLRAADLDALVIRVGE